MIVLILIDKGLAVLNHVKSNSSCQERVSTIVFLWRYVLIGKFFLID